jgi:hypothetical protein
MKNRCSTFRRDLASAFHGYSKQIHQNASRVSISEMSDLVPFWQRVFLKLYPSRYCDLPTAPKEYRDVLVFNSVTRFGFLDRLRILVTGRVQTRAKIVTQNTIGYTVSDAVCYPIPPFD